MVLDADKNRGNVSVRRKPWIKFNYNHIKDNHNNYKLVNLNKFDIIKNGIDAIKNIIFNFKIYIEDYKKIIKKLYSKKHNKIGIWSSIPKVHKKDINGNLIKKIRPIINMKQTITTISSTIIKEITRKLIYGIKSMYQSEYECDDIRDIIINIDKFNNTNTINHDDQIVVCDINSMYDNISIDDVIKAFNVAINELLPINYISLKLIDLWKKAINHSFKCYHFEYQNDIYLQINSQIQGSVSGGDACSWF